MGRIPQEHSDEDMVTAESVRHGVLQTGTVVNGVAVGMSCEWDISQLLRINGEDYDNTIDVIYDTLMANDTYTYILYIVCSVYYYSICSVYIG